MKRVMASVLLYVTIAAAGGIGFWLTLAVAVLVTHRDWGFAWSVLTLESSLRGLEGEMIFSMVVGGSVSIALIPLPVWTWMVRRLQLIGEDEIEQKQAKMIGKGRKASR